MARNAVPRIRKVNPNAEASLRKALHEAGKSAVRLYVQADDLYGVLDELRAVRAKNAALWREMSGEFPGMDGLNGDRQSNALRGEGKRNA